MSSSNIEPFHKKSSWMSLPQSINEFDKKKLDLTVKYYKENELDITYGKRRKDKTKEEKH